MTTGAEIFLLTYLLLNEASILSEKGAEHVAMVTINRVNIDWHPNYLSGVIHESGQYEWIMKPEKRQRINPNKPNEVKKWEQLKTIAKRILDNRNNIPEPCMLNFHDDSIIPNWNFKRLQFYKKIDNMVFYIDKKCKDEVYND